MTTFKVTDTRAHLWMTLRASSCLLAQETVLQLVCLCTIWRAHSWFKDSILKADAALVALDTGAFPHENIHCGLNSSAGGSALCVPLPSCSTIHADSQKEGNTKAHGQTL